MTEEKKNVVHDIEGQLALSRSQQWTEITTPIPTWPIRVVNLFAIGFSIGLIDGATEYKITRWMIGITFILFAVCVQNTLDRLQKRVVALSEYIKSERTS